MNDATKEVGALDAAPIERDILNVVHTSRAFHTQAEEG